MERKMSSKSSAPKKVTSSRQKSSSSKKQSEQECNDKHVMFAMPESQAQAQQRKRTVNNGKHQQKKHKTNAQIAAIKKDQRELLKHQETLERLRYESQMGVVKLTSSVATLAVRNAQLEVEFNQLKETARALKTADTTTNFDSSMQFANKLEMDMNELCDRLDCLVTADVADCMYLGLLDNFSAAIRRAQA